MVPLTWELGRWLGPIIRTIERILSEAAGGLCALPPIGCFSSTPSKFHEQTAVARFFPWRNPTTGIDKDGQALAVPVHQQLRSATLRSARHVALGNNFPTPMTRPSHLGANVNVAASTSRCLGHLRKLIAKSSPSCRPECLVLWRRLGTAQAAWASVITEPQRASAANLNQCVHCVHFVHFLHSVPTAKPSRNPESEEPATCLA